MSAQESYKEPALKKQKLDPEISVQESKNENSEIPANIANSEDHPKPVTQTLTDASNEPDKCTLDPLAYTKTEHFTSEIFKICMENIPKYANAPDVRKFLKKHDLEAVKVKRPFKTSYAYVTFRDEATRQKALEKLQDVQWKKNSLKVDIAKPDENPFARNEARGEKRLQDFRSVREKTAPLYEMTLSEQLELKLGEIQGVLDNFKKLLKRSWQAGFPEEHYKFKITEIKQSPVLTGYRNKCEFTIGKNTDTNDENCIGFVKGSFSHGNISVQSPDECKETCSELMIAEVKKFKDFLSTSKFPTYNNISNTGVWKALQIRTTEQQEVMITPVVDKRSLDPEMLKDLKLSVIEFYSNRQKCSVFLKLVGGKEEVVHLSGPDHMLEKLCGYDFQITSGSFFQVNTSGAEVLYQTIRETAELDDKTILLDVCCGTGTIGIILSKYVKRVHGIEIVESAVEDAKKNAERNKINNIAFYAGNAKSAVPRVVNNIIKSPETRIVAIVDPPRNGVHADVIACLRKNEMISEIVYVSCDIKQISDNIVNLCSPTSNRYLGDPFRFVSCVAVDLFPHTKRYEVIFHLKR